MIEKYIQQGFSVIPLEKPRIGSPSGKKPLIAWKEFAQRKATDEELERWFQRDVNVGIVTGAISNLVVIDCDSEEATQFVKSRFPTESIVCTGSGGTHFYYRHPGTLVGNRANIDGMKLDVRGDGGYIVAPPSMHWKGKRYTWQQDTARTVFNPDWFPQKKFVPTVTECVSPDDAQLRARRYISRIHSIAGQGGDAQLFKAACALCQKFQLPEDIAIAELRSWNATNADPPWSDQRLIYKISEARRLI